MKNDLQLIRRYLAGDLSAFEALFERHERQVYSFAFHMTGDKTEADDLCQDIWLEALRSLATFEGKSAFRGWIHGVAVNVSRRRYRKKTVQHVPLENGITAHQPGISADTATAAAEARVLLQEALPRLPDEQREVVILHELQGFSYAEIAQIIGCPNGTVKSRLHYAIAALRRMICTDDVKGR